MRWYLSNNGQISGPVDEVVVAAWRDQGQIRPGTTACREGDSTWVPFEQTPLAVNATQAAARRSGNTILMILVPLAALVLCAGLLAVRKPKAKAAPTVTATETQATTAPAAPRRTEVSALARAMGGIIENPDLAARSVDKTGKKTLTWSLKPLPGVGFPYFVRYRSDKDAWRFGLENMPCSRIGELGLTLHEISRREAPIGRGMYVAWYAIEGGPLDGTFAKVSPMGVNDVEHCTVLPGTGSYWALSGQKIGD